MKTWITALAGLVTLMPVWAGPITVTFSFTGSGTVGTTPFSNASVLITDIGDTTANTPFGVGVFLMHPTSSTIAITSFALATVTDPNTTGINQGAHSAYFSTPGDELFVGDPAFGSYSLLTSLGPLTPGSINTFGWGPSSPVHTDRGNIVITQSSNPSYQAVVGASAVPEPGTIALMLVGLIAIVAIRLRAPDRATRRTLRSCGRLAV